MQFVESMNGIRAVQAFRRQDRNEQIMAALNDQFRDANTDALGRDRHGSPRPCGWIGNLSLALVLAIGAYRVVDGGLALGVLTAFTLYLRRFYDPLDELAMFANSYTSAIAALEKISGVLEEEPTVVEPATPVACPSRDTGREIEFDAVEFRYSARRRWCCRRSTCTSPPVRQWRWWARRARASRRSRSWSAVSTTRPPALVRLDGVVAA